MYVLTGWLLHMCLKKYEFWEFISGLPRNMSSFSFICMLNKTDKKQDKYCNYTCIKVETVAFE